MITVASVTALSAAALYGMDTAIRGGSFSDVLSAEIEAFNRWFLITALLYSSISALSSLWLCFLGFSSPGAYGSLKYADKYDICSYNLLTELLKNTGLSAHHIIPQRFAQLLGLDPNRMLCVAVDGNEHQYFTNLWRMMIPYGEGTVNASKEQILEAARLIYQHYPMILEVAEIQIKAAGG
jgi:hypothetical protein